MMRDVRSELSVDADLERIYGSAQLADECMRGLMTLLSKDPECGKESSKKVRLIDSQGSGIWKVLTFWYTFDDEYVTILKVVASDG